MWVSDYKAGSSMKTDNRQRSEGGKDGGYDGSNCSKVKSRWQEKPGYSLE